MKLKFLILCAALTLICSITVADDASHRAETEELLLLINADDSLQAVWGQVEAMMESQFAQMGGSDKQKPVFKKYIQKMRNVFEEEMGWDKIKHNFIDVYVKTYSEDEIHGILAFYQSPVGKKYAEKMPQLIKESMAITKKIMPAFTQKMQVITRDMVAELQQPAEQPQTLPPVGTN